MNKNIFKNKNILITGGTGSFGTKFVTHLLDNKFPLKKIIIFSRDEFKQDELARHFDIKKNFNLRFLIGDIRDRDRLNFAFKDVNYIVHAAALKQVPAAEYNPIEFVKTNILGSQNIIESAISNNVQKVIALSTDKAASPINLYGATKLCSDKLFIAANNIIGKKKISFSVVRYGNVWGSRGSVVPLFLHQKRKKILTVTNLEMTRFNIELEESAKIVLWSLQNLIGGEILVPKLYSYKVLDLAKAICNDCKIKIIGTRPGEKIHEELITVSDSDNTFEAKNHFLILGNYNPFLFKYYKNKGYKKVEKNFSYTSKNNDKYLNISQLKNILELK
jgi:UDP-N-acetylglucosamine 4,6-dehydratase (inverting)